MKFNDFIQHLKDREASLRTQETYSSALKCFFIKHDSMTAESIKSFLGDYKTPGSKRTMKAVLKSYADFEGINIPWNKIVVPRLKKKMPRVLDESERERVHRWIKARDPHYADVFLFLLHTALRSAEVINLAPNDLRTSSSGSYLVIREPKNGYDRAVPLDNVASRLVNKLGLPIKYRRQVLTSYIKEAREALSLPKFVPHTLRKTCLTRLHRDGADVMSIARFSGHRDVNSLMDYLATDADSIRTGVFKHDRPIDDRSRVTR